MPVRLTTTATLNADAAIDRTIWNLTQPSLAAVWPETNAVKQISTNAAGLVIMKAIMAGQTRQWEDASLTVQGFLCTGPQAFRGGVAEEARALMPRPSISVTLFRQVCKELLNDWFLYCLANKIEKCWGKFPSSTPANMRQVFDLMAAKNGAVETTDAKGFHYWTITPQQGLTGLTGL